MMKTFFSISAGIFFLLATFFLVAVYWIFGLLARIMSLILLPLRKLLAPLKSS